MVDMTDIISTNVAKAFLAVAALVEFASAADLCDDLNSCKRRYGFAVAVGVVSFVLVVVQLLLERFADKIAARIELPNAVFHVIWWVAGAWVNTGSSGPFEAVGNGYFATWAALLLSLYWAWDAFGMVGWEKLVPRRRQPKGEQPPLSNDSHTTPEQEETAERV